MKPFGHNENNKQNVILQTLK